MSEAWTAAGISNLIIHDFRRTRRGGSISAKDLYAAQVFLGHSDSKTTQDYIGLRRDFAPRCNTAVICFATNFSSAAGERCTPTPSRRSTRLPNAIE